MRNGGGSITYDPRVPLAPVWFWNNNTGGLTHQDVPPAAWGDVMAMRAAEHALRLGTTKGDPASLWLAANNKREVDLNGQPFGRADAGVDMTFDFGTLVAHLAKTRNLSAGTIIGSGTVSNRDEGGGPGKPVARGGRGYSCLAEIRTVETILDGKPATPFLQAGDQVRIWMEDATGHSIFGAIEQVVS